MKKTFSNVISKLALAGVALVGVFASCQQDDLNATFAESVPGAEVRIAVTVRSKVTLKEVDCNITTEPNYPVDQATGVVTITPATGKEIPAMSVKITATPKNTKWAAASTTVAVNALRAGGKGSYTANILIDDDLTSQYYFDTVEEDIVVEGPTKLYIGDATHSIDGMKYRCNPTEFMLHGSVDYYTVSGYQFDDTSFDVKPGATDAEALYAFDGFCDLDVPLTPVNSFLEIWVSAWCYYSVYQVGTLYKDVYGCFKRAASGDELLATGEFNFVDSQAAEYAEEVPYNSHYSDGHGSYDASHDTYHGAYNGGHGTGNAGGGIVYAE